MNSAPLTGYRVLELGSMVAGPFCGRLLADFGAEVVRALVDEGSIFELKPRFGAVAVTALARLGGRTVGFIADNPLFKGGAMGTDTCEKVTKFLVTCDSFNIPLIFLVDTPGFAIGTEAERRRAPGKIMNFMQALQLCRVPKISVILRKSYGQVYLNRGGGPMR